MAPNPLSRVRPKAKVVASPEAIEKRPELAPLIAQIIVQWAYVEANICSILAYIMKTEAGPTVAMLYALRNSSAQFDMVAKAARVKLFDPELEAVETVISIARTAAYKRNAVAHNIWAYTDDLPDALLLTETEAYASVFVEAQSWDGKSLADLPTPDRSRTLVYKEADLRAILKEMRDAQYCTTLLINYVGRSPSVLRDEIYRLLCSERLFRAALSKLRKDRKPRPAL